MLNRLEIILTEANDKPVSLRSMSLEALDSFMTVMSSLKSIAESNNKQKELVFSISEGSALCAVEAPAPIMDSIYSGMNTAIKGNSNDKVITKHLRLIQGELKRDKFNYKFRYNNKKETIDLHPILIKSTKIALKRKSKLPYTHKLVVCEGLLNQIGGKDPNYHFNSGISESKTIDCTKEDAMKVNKFLYQNVKSLILCKEWVKADKKTEYFHKVILEEKIARDIRSFLKLYNKEENILNKLTITHDYIDDMFENSDRGHEFLKCLLLAFNDNVFNLSEIKTLLVISKPFKEHKDIKYARKELLETYEKKRN